MKERPQSTTGFEHDRPYMKLDIWNAGDIERLFGHDPATYPNQDLFQHYPTVQFNPPVRTDIEGAIDSNLNIHVIPHQKAVQTSRPGFENAPFPLGSYNSTHKVAEDTSNVEGIKFAKDNGLPTIEETEVCYGKADTKAYTSRPGFENFPTGLQNAKNALAISKLTSNKEALDHAEVYGVPVKEGYQVIEGSCESPKETLKPSPGPQKPATDECDPNGADGTLCDTEKREDGAAAAVDKLLGTQSTPPKSVDDLAAEATALEEALKASGVTDATDAENQEG